jgi:glycerophosphoryl diester phosphodiesterase
MSDRTANLSAFEDNHMFRSLKVSLIFCSVFLFLPIVTTAARPRNRSEATLRGQRPIVIGHRGASGYRPEHTLAAYELAIKMGADYIEPDLVSTRDGELVARHENAIAIVDPASGAIIEATTDVAERPEFKDRLTTKNIDGEKIRGWFTEDFTLAELKTLRAKERLPKLRPQSAKFDGQFQIPTLQEIIDLAKRSSQDRGRKIGIYPETKHPTYHDSIGLSLEEPLVKVLEANGYTNQTDPVFIQSFETQNLRELNRKTRVQLIQLLGGATERPYDFVVSGNSKTYGDLATPQGLREIATYANGIGPSKRLIIPAATLDENGDGKPDDLNSDGQISDADRILKPPTTLVQDAHQARLLVHPYTFRNESFFLARDYNNNPKAEYFQFFSLGVDGLFSDFPDTAVQARNQCKGGTCPQVNSERRRRQLLRRPVRRRLR